MDLAFLVVFDGPGMDDATLRLVAVDLVEREVVDLVLAEAERDRFEVDFLLLDIDFVFPEVVDFALRVRLAFAERPVLVCFLGIIPPVGTSDRAMMLH